MIKKQVESVKRKREFFFFCREGKSPVHLLSWFNVSATTAKIDLIFPFLSLVLMRLVVEGPDGVCCCGTKGQKFIKRKKKDDKHGLFQLVLEFLRGPIVVVLFFRKI